MGKTRIGCVSVERKKNTILVWVLIINETLMKDTFSTKKSFSKTYQFRDETLSVEYDDQLQEMALINPQCETHRTLRFDMSKLNEETMVYDLDSLGEMSKRRLKQRNKRR